jgi:short-subunit dehydrogenase
VKAGFVDGLFSLNGRRAVVTGGNAGLGEAMATALGLAGAAVLLVARREVELQAAAERLRADGIEVDTLALDLGRTEALPAAGSAMLQRAGRIDILVNAAGINLRSPSPTSRPKPGTSRSRCTWRHRSS